MGYRWRVPVRQRLTKSQREARVAFAWEHLQDSWDETWAYDEAYFQLYRTKNRCWIKVSTEEATAPPHLTRAQERVSIGIAVAISRGRQSALTLLSSNWTADHLMDLFDASLYPSLDWSNRRGHQSRLIIDNDGRHPSHAWLQYMARRRLRPIRPWPSNSPDLNPIENVFAWMKASVEQAAPTTRPDLEAAIREAWRSYPIESTERLMDSMTDRLQAVIDNKGRRIKY